MPSLTPCLSVVWINGPLERIAHSSGKDGERGGMFPADTNGSGCDDSHPIQCRSSNVQADDVFRLFYEQILCQVGPTRAIEQAQHELRQRIEHPGEVRDGVVDG